MNFYIVPIEADIIPFALVWGAFTIALIKTFID